MDVLISGTMAIESANLAFFLKKKTEQASSISGRIVATTCPVLHAHEQCRCSTRPSAFLPEPVHPPQLMALDHSPPSSLDGDPCTVGCQHSCAQRGGRRERGDGNADPPRPVRSRRGHGQPGTAGHEPRRHYCPPPCCRRLPPWSRVAATCDARWKKLRAGGGGACNGRQDRPG